MRLRPRPFHPACVVAAVAAACLVCAGASRAQGAPAAQKPAQTSAPVSLAEVLAPLRARAATQADSEALQRAAQALNLTAQMNLPRASSIINEALQLDARNPNLHFFNGLIYHLQARQGDSEKADLALEGYRQAVRIDPHHWVAHEFLGLALWERRQYPQAQAAFAEVVIARPQDAVALSRMMAASYMSGDAAAACAMAKRLDDVQTDASAADKRTRAVVYGSCGEFEQADALRQTLSKGDAGARVEWLDARMADWRNLHGRAATNPPRMRPVQLNMNSYPGMPGGLPGASSILPAAGFGGIAGMNSGVNTEPSAVGAVQAGQAKLDPNATRMVLVDVVMVRTEDTIATTRGINLLNALTLQFGSQGAPAYSRNFNSSADSLGNTLGTTLITRAITVPALAYSLNLANANSNLNEVLARPTLAAVEGMRSEFFSGTSLNAAVVSGGTGTAGSAVAIERKYGVKLSILPRILPDGQIMLAVDAARTFLKPPSTNISFTYKLEISEIVANANVVMRMGDTLILGGLSEKESTNTRDGVPVLQDVPGLQYLFSQQVKSDFQRSVLILITPRPVAYSWLTEESRAAIAAEGETAFTPSMDVLRARYSDWFKPYPNLASVFHHLNSADLYRQFRTGDVTLENWDRMKTTSERLEQALQFLYY